MKRSWLNPKPVGGAWGSACSGKNDEPATGETHEEDERESRSTFRETLWVDCRQSEI